MTVFELLRRLDKILLLLINHDSSWRYLDNFMLFVRNPVSWIPLYLFLIWYFFKYTGKQALPIIIFSIINVGLTDILSTLGKNIFERLRPCYDIEIGNMVRHLVDCGGEYSFPSSHAANHFGLAAFLFWSVYKVTGKKWQWLWIWATIICYAQIYLGKHFPSDIVAGAFLGVLIGTTLARIFELYVDARLPIPKVSFPFSGKHLPKRLI